MRACAWVNNICFGKIHFLFFFHVTVHLHTPTADCKRGNGLRAEAAVFMFMLFCPPFFVALMFTLNANLMRHWRDYIRSCINPFIRARSNTTTTATGGSTEEKDTFTSSIADS